MPAEKVELTEEAIQAALESHIYAVSRCMDDCVAELWVSNDEREIDEKVAVMRLRPGKLSIYCKTD